MFVQIYSRASGKYIQVKRNGVDAGGVNGSQYGKDADLCMCVFNIKTCRDRILLYN